MKKLIIFLCFVLSLSLTACGGGIPSKENLSPLVSAAILSENTGGYSDGECCGEGHIILGSRLKGNCLKVYALTMYGNYGFRNDMFIKVSGSGVIPAVLTFQKGGTDYNLLTIEYPRDGAEYEKSIKRMFPLQYRSAALRSDNAHDQLQAQERSYAEAYLQSIGRETVIGEYKDLNTVLLTDFGISVEVSNRLSCDKRLWQYPYWVGTAESLENGTRYVRSLSLDESAERIIYQTVEKESGSVIETFIFDTAVGDELIP